MKKNKITLAKIIKLPIEGISFSNKQVEVEIEYDAEGFDINQATDEINKMMETLKEVDPEWLRNPQPNLPIVKKGGPKKGGGEKR